MQPQSAGFGDPQAVAEHQQDEAAVAGLGAAAAGSGDQALDLARGEVFAVAHRFVQCSGKKRGAKPRRCWGWSADIRQKGSFCPIAKNEKARLAEPGRTLISTDFCCQTIDILISKDFIDMSQVHA